MKHYLFRITLFILSSLLSWISFSAHAEQGDHHPINKKTILREQRPIVIQGAMPLESKKFAGLLNNVKKQSFGPYDFWIGSINHYPADVFTE